MLIESVDLSIQEKVDAVRGFIQDNYVYALDSSFNNAFNGYRNQIEAIENTYVEMDGEKYHPAICNVSALMAVAYLRELWIPSLVVDWLQHIDQDQYGLHAWIKYYNEERRTWEFMDPTPTRQYWEIKKFFEDAWMQKAYELEQEKEKTQFDIQKKTRTNRWGED